MPADKAVVSSLGILRGFYGALLVSLLAAVLPATGLAQRQMNQGYSLLLHFQPSYMEAISEDLEVEADRTGYYGAVGAYFSAVSRNLILDFGAGWFHTELDGTDPKTREELDENGEKREVVTTFVGTEAGYAEFSPRLRLNNFHIGSQISVHYGEDTSFGPTVQKKDETHVYIGGQAGWISRWEDWDIRFAVRYDTDVTIRERTVNMLGMSLTVGLPIWKPEHKKIVKYRDRVHVQEVPVHIPIHVPVEIEVVKFIIPSDLVNFEFDRSKLTPAGRKFLEDLASFISQNEDLWQSISIEGHTDSRGTHGYNLRLAKMRAKKTGMFLAARGVNPNRIRIKSYGETQLLDPRQSEVAHARNRRVELHFKGVTDANKLHEGLERIRKAHHLPTTCKGKACR